MSTRANLNRNFRNIEEESRLLFELNQRNMNAIRLEDLELQIRKIINIEKKIKQYRNRVGQQSNRESFFRENERKLENIKDNMNKKIVELKNLINIEPHINLLDSKIREYNQTFQLLQERISRLNQVSNIQQINTNYTDINRIIHNLMQNITNSIREFNKKGLTNELEVDTKLLRIMQQINTLKDQLNAILATKRGTIINPNMPNMVYGFRGQPSRVAEPTRPVIQPTKRSSKESSKM
jgi:hypothetical protein